MTTPAAREPSDRFTVGRLGRLGARLGHGIGMGIFYGIYRASTPGRENVPKRGPVILAVNHTAFLDAPLVVGVAGRPVHVFSKSELFHGALGIGMRAIGQIPLHRDTADRTALLTGLDVLARGGVLVVFPEGSRGAGDFSDMRSGLAWLAMRSQAPLVPVICRGTGARGSSTIGGLPRARSRMAAIFGAPFTVPPPAPGVGPRTALLAAQELVRARLLEHHAYAYGLELP